MAQDTPLLEMFGCCTPYKEMCGGLERAGIRSVIVSRETRSMEIEAFFAAKPEEGALSRMENAIASEFGLASVYIRADYPRQEPEKKKDTKKKDKPTPGTPLLGKAPKGEKSVPIREITLESNTVTVTGKVFEVTSRKIARNNAAVLGFSITDYTGSIQVSKYLRSQDDMTILDKIHMGDRLTVRGNVAFNRYDGDISIDPSAIVLEAPVVRMDTAPGEKRVELHLHTRYSTLDALTDPSAAVKTAGDTGPLPSLTTAWHRRSRNSGMPARKTALRSFTAWRATT